MYQTFAIYYDRLMNQQFYDNYHLWIADFLNGNNILDLGCGTGILPILLKNSTNNITGIDLSPAMIDVAIQNAQEANLKINFEVNNIIEYTALNKYNTIICSCDVINYLTDWADVALVFKRSFENLASNGTFIFDIISPFYVQNVINDYFEVEKYPDFGYEWRTKLISDLTVEHQLKITNDNGVHEEIHIQRTESADFYEDLLKVAGFNEIIVTSDFSSEFKVNGHRHFFIAKK